MGIMNGAILLAQNKRLLGWGKALGVSLGPALTNEKFFVMNWSSENSCVVTREVKDTE